MKAKLKTLQQKLAQGFVGRDDIIKSVLLAMIAGENSLLIGPPGTGKSMVARRLSKAIKTEQNTAYFEYLLTKFSTPEEIFGPLSISELKKDRFHRNTEGYLPTAQVAFLDEIFKASSSILNALLTILNERKFHNGTHSQDIPLLSLIGASNELPNGQAELAALYDRFLIRRYVDYVGDNELAQLFDLRSPETIGTDEALTADDIIAIQETAKTVAIPSDVKRAITKIWTDLKIEFKENADEQFSDRRFVKIIHLLKVSAATNNRTEMDLSDVFLLKDCLWNNPENMEKIKEIIGNVLRHGTSQATANASMNVSYRNNKVPLEDLRNIKAEFLPRNAIIVQIDWKVKVGDLVTKNQEIAALIDINNNLYKVLARENGVIKKIFTLPKKKMHLSSPMKTTWLSIGNQNKPTYIEVIDLDRNSIIAELGLDTSMPVVKQKEEKVVKSMDEQLKSNIWL